MTQSLASASRTLTAGPEDAGERLDRWLAAQLPEHSRSEIQRWIKGGDVRINGEPARSSHRLDAGETVELALPVRPVEAGPDAEPIPLAILYEDDDLLV